MRRVSTLCQPPAKRGRADEATSDAGLARLQESTSDMVLEDAEQQQQQPETPFDILRNNDTVARRLRDDTTLVQAFALPQCEIESIGTDVLLLHAFVRQTGNGNQADRAVCIDAIGQFMWRVYKQTLPGSLVQHAVNTRSFFVNACTNSRSSTVSHRRFLVVNAPNAGENMQVLQVNLCACQRHTKGAVKWRTHALSTASVLVNNPNFIDQLYIVLSVLWAETPRQVFCAMDKAKQLWPAPATT